MNDVMIKTINDLENYLNKNLNEIDVKLKKMDKFDESNNKGRSKKKKGMDEKIENIILDDEKLIEFLDDMSEYDIKDISDDCYEEILNRLMILNLINKNKPNLNKKYSGLIQKLLECKKIKNKISNNNNMNMNSQRYKISSNLEHNLYYLFNSLNN